MMKFMNFTSTDFILQNIDDDVIYNQKNIQNQLKTHIFFLKYLGNVIWLIVIINIETSL